MIERRIRPQVLEALTDTRVVMVMGARQVGKSTLCESIVAGEHPAEVVSFDDDAPREAALEDPAGFLAGLERPVFIDEIQRAPSLILAIKRVVDRDKRPGQFLLSGSANLLSSRRVQEALTGRIELMHLSPFARSEIEGAAGNIVDALFAAAPPRVAGRASGGRRSRLPSRRAATRMRGCGMRRGATAGFRATCERRSSGTCARSPICTRSTKWAACCGCSQRAPGAS